MRDVVFPENTQANYDAYGYAAAVRSGGFLFVSGQVGVDAAGNAIAEPSAQFEQANSAKRRALRNLNHRFQDHLQTFRRRKTVIGVLHER